MAPQTEAPATPEISRYQLSEWKKGQALFTATDDANFREKPDAAAKVLKTLPFGTRVTVRAPATGRVQVSDRVDRWYEVDVSGEKGFLFGNVLTPFLFEDDFDGDGDKERASVAFTADFKIRVRFFEAATKHVTSVDLEPFGGAYLNVKGGNAKAKLIPASKAGLPLVWVTSRMEACADYGDYYVSNVGKPRIALTLVGLTDPPVLSSYDAKFDPKAKKVTVLRKDTELTEDGKEESTKKTHAFALKDGVFVDAAGKSSDP